MFIRTPRHVLTALACALCLATSASAQKRAPRDSSAADTTHRKPPAMSMPMPMTGAAHEPMADSSRMSMPPTDSSASDTGAMDDMRGMTGPFGISMDRMGSGTTWIPDAVMLPSHHQVLGEWGVMIHGFVFGQYDKQGFSKYNPRGDDQLGSLNWGMLMVEHAAKGGRIQFRTMLSLDPLTVSNRGYPLLLQSGETYRGAPLHDRQHPHDFWMELGALYERPVTSSVGVSIYAAPSGEPALGPVAFMHRPSAMDDPVVPLGHHWQDATHISFGVLTAGLFGRTWKVEASHFNGREPNEKRWDFDRMKLDSWSGRVTVNPTAHWSVATGFGYLKSPESLEPDMAMHRVVASVLHGTAFGADGQWATTLLYGGNKHPGESLTSSALIESELIADRRNTYLGRIEFVQKSAGDLVLTGPASDVRYNIGAIAAGYIREIGRTHGATLGLGVRGSLNLIPSTLAPFYGSRAPLGGMIFIRLRPFHHHKTAMSPMSMPMGHSHSGE